MAKSSLGFDRRRIASGLKLLYFASEDLAFLSHFLPIARTARDIGFEVTVAARLTSDEIKLTDEGFAVAPIAFRRGSLRLVVALLAIKQLIDVIRREKPDVVHCVGLPMVVLGGIAAKICGINRIVLAPTGLGHIWIKNTASTRLLREIVRWTVSSLLNGKQTHYLFENREDPMEFGLTTSNSNLAFVSGAGVEAALFPPTKEPPSPPVKVAVVSRMLRPKGIFEAVQATIMAIERGAPLELHLFGAPDRSNPESLSDCDLRLLCQKPGVYWHGKINDIPTVWRNCHIALLLSYREGLPKSLVEAAASCRPIIASDVVGCRELVRHGIDGYLVSMATPDDAAARLVELASSPELRTRMGSEARRRFEERFSTEKVVEAIASFYRSLITN